jgi:hypothetical protein
MPQYEQRDEVSPRGRVDLADACRCGEEQWIA